MGRKLRKLLAENLQSAMDAKGLVQMDIEHKTGIGQSSVSRILREQTAVTLDLLEELARAVELLPWELLVDSEETREKALRKILGAHKGDKAA